MSDDGTTDTGRRGAAAEERRSSGPGEGADPAAGTDPADATDLSEAAAAADGGPAADRNRVEQSNAASVDTAEDDESAHELDALQAELDSLNERHLRLAAEFDNYRKRIRREREGLRTRAQADFAKELLEVLDDLQRVADYEEDATSVDALLEGVQLVEKKLRRAMTALGLEPIDAEGEFFNPGTMEAMMTVPAEHPEEDDVVADVFQRGYRFQNTLIRPARVRVKKYEQD